MTEVVDAPEEVSAPEDEQPSSEVEQSEESGTEEERQPERSLEEVLADPSVIEKVLASGPAKERLQQEIQRAENRARDKALAEQRRRLGNPQAVEAAMLDILKDAGLDRDSITDSMRMRAQNLYTIAARSVADQFAEQIPEFFFKGYKFDQDTLTRYQDAIAASDTDGAFQALVDGAVTLKDAEREAAFEKRIKAEVDRRVRAELESANGNGGVPLPATSRGSAARNDPQSLTTAEIERLPGAVWRKLPDEVKDTIYRNVSEADSKRGATSVDMGRLERIAALAR